MKIVESAIVDFEKSLAQHTSQQGGVCVTFSVLSVDGCDFDQEASFLIKATGAFIKAPAAVQGLSLHRVIFRSSNIQPQAINAQLFRKRR